MQKTIAYSAIAVGSLAIFFAFGSSIHIASQPNHLHCALIMRSKARLFTIYESDANKVTFHSTL